jgi:hypothetical protein
MVVIQLLRKLLRNDLEIDWDDDSFASIPVCLIVLGLLVALKIPLDIYIPRPTVFQISTNGQEYIVEDYDPFFGLRFDCESKTIYPGTATITTIPRGKVIPNATYCK